MLRWLAHAAHLARPGSRSGGIAAAGGTIYLFRV